MHEIDDVVIREFNCVDHEGNPVKVTEHALLSTSKALLGDRVRTSSRRTIFLMEAGSEVVAINDTTFQVLQSDGVLTIV